MIAKKVIFSGQVQGVGFRATAVRISREFQITGYVKNLSDGTVEVVMEGEHQEIEIFLKKIKDVMKNYISDAQMIEQEVKSLNQFKIQK